MSKKSAFAAAVALLANTLAPKPLRAQDVLRTPTLTQLGKDQYKSIVDVRERTSGAVIVSDPDDASLWTVSTKGDRKNAATNGAPGAPGRMIGIGDSIVYFNRMSSGFKVLKPDGSISDAPLSFAPPEGAMRFAPTSDAYAADVRGQLYWLDGNLDPRGASLKKRDATTQVAVVATLKNPGSSTVRQGAIAFTRSVPFSPADDWAVSDSGLLAVVRAEPYHVELIAAGTTKTGTARTVALAPTMDADKQVIARSRQKAMSSINLNGVSIGGAGGDDSLPALKAPFARGTTRVALNGSVWVQRAVAANATVALIDVFGADGNYRETLSLPKGARIVGFGARRTFVAVPVDDVGAATLHAFDH